MQLPKATDNKGCLYFTILASLHTFWMLKSEKDKAYEGLSDTAMTSKHNFLDVQNKLKHFVL
jgi:hypothetical protein